MSAHYTPAVGRAGDVIPYSADGVLHVFYLRTPVGDEPHNTTAWYHVSTRDLVTWTEHGEAIGRGAPEDQDASVATGSIIEADGRYYAFYTGFADVERTPSGRSQGVLRASSTDLETWTKDADFTTLLAREDDYDRDDWRDPFVYRDTDGTYRMLLAAQRRTGPAARRGVVALLTSPDLDHWTLREPLWAPGLHAMHECPDLFRIGNWWYLIFSTFTDRQITCYRMARSPEGPWLAPDDDALDDDGLYAAKTAVLDGERYLVGWVPTRDPATDAGTWQWGGSLVVHHVVQRPDGTVGVRIPQQVLDALEPLQAPVEPRSGEWVIRHAPGRHVSARPHGAPSEPRARQALGDGDAVGDVWSVAADSSHAWATWGAMAESGRLDVRIEVERPTRRVGVLLHADANADAGYELYVDVARRLLVLDRTPRLAFARPLHTRPLTWDGSSPLDLTVVWDGETLVACVDDVVLTARGLDHRGGGAGLFVSEGRARFTVPSA